MRTTPERTTPEKQSTSSGAQQHSAMAPRALLPVLLALLLALLGARADDDLNVFGAWRAGRGTFYGSDAWSIHAGGCNYGHLSPGEPLGWNVAAMTDVDPLYVRGVCGFFLEVKCSPSVIRDGYGQQLDRTGVYAPNQYSNKRWCCGDMPHLDLSYITFGSLGPTYWGVLGLQFRQVPCWYRPSVPASQAPYAWQDSTYNPSAPLPLRFWPEYQSGAPPPAATFNASGLNPTWWDASWSTYTVPWQQTSTSGLGGGPALCAKIYQGGALSLQTWQWGAFAQRTRLSFWMYVGVTGYAGEQAQVADITISISGTKGFGCGVPRIWNVKPTQFAPRCTTCTDYWWLWDFSLAGFVPGGDPNQVIRPGDFQGCGANGVNDLNRIHFRNDGYGGGGDKYLCLSNIRLL